MRNLSAKKLLEARTIRVWEKSPCPWFVHPLWISCSAPRDAGARSKLWPRAVAKQPKEVKAENCWKVSAQLETRIHTAEVKQPKFTHKDAKMMSGPWNTRCCFDSQICSVEIQPLNTDPKSYLTTEHPRTGNNCLRAVWKRDFVYLPAGQRQHRHQLCMLPSLPSVSLLSSTARGEGKQLVLHYLIPGPASEDTRWADRQVPALTSLPWMWAPAPATQLALAARFLGNKRRQPGPWHRVAPTAQASPRTMTGWNPSLTSLMQWF